MAITHITTPIDDGQKFGGFNDGSSRFLQASVIVDDTGARLGTSGNKLYVNAGTISATVAPPAPVVLSAALDLGSGAYAAGDQVGQGIDLTGIANALYRVNICALDTIGSVVGNYPTFIAMDQGDVAGDHNDAFGSVSAPLQWADGTSGLGATAKSFQITSPNYTMWNLGPTDSIVICRNDGSTPNPGVSADAILVRIDLLPVSGVVS